MKIVDLFSGVGGFSYAAEQIVGGFETVAFVERDEYCQKVLRKHWKDVPIYNDIRSFNGKEFRDADIVVGGFPCQPWSVAGAQKGSEDDRDLWHEMVRIIEDIRPRWVIGENVSGFVTMPMGLRRSLSDLESIGYKAIPYLIPAAAVDAKHRRMRCWVVGYTEHDGSSTTPFRGRNNEADGGSTQGQNKARELEGASGRTDNEFVQTDIFDLMADTDNTRDRTPRSGIDTEQQTIEQGRADISQSESSRQREDVANTNNNGHKGRCVETRNETPTRQDTQSEWRANSEIIGGQSNDGRDQEKSRVNEDLRRSRDDCSPKLTSSTGVCRLPTGADNNQRISGENRHQENNNRTLVSQGSKRFQSPKHRGLGKDKATLEANKVQSRDDIDRDKGMEEQKSNVSNTESKGLEGRIHSATISTERNESTHSGNIHSRERDNVADTNNQGVRTRINGSDDDLPKESGSRGDDRTTSTGDVGLHTKTTKNGEMGLSKERNPAFRERPILWDAEPSVGRVANGIPNRVHRLRCLGNSIVPQVVARIFYAIKEAENVKEV